MMSHRLIAVICCGWLGLGNATAHGADPPPLMLEYESADRLPEFQLGGKPARVHTQGLYVTDRHYFVTGRLETQPRRALFLRFPRKAGGEVEYLDITPQNKDDEPALDHPGGFDFDGRDFWIPISASRPRSHTVVLRIPHRPDQPLAGVRGKTAFVVDDHIGALAYDRAADEVFGANWDTKTIYRWRPDGTVLESIPRSELVRGDDAWGLAVQDWKGLGRHGVIAGGIDKREGLQTSASRAVIAQLDIRGRSLRGLARLPMPPGEKHAATREGLATSGDRVYLLPADLGEGAKIYCYRWRNAPQ